MKTAVLLTVALLGAVHLATAAPLMLLAAYEDPAAETAEKRAIAAEISELQRELFKSANPSATPAPIVVQVPTIDIDRQLAVADAWEKLILKWAAVGTVIVGALATLIALVWAKVAELRNTILKDVKERQARQSARMDSMQTQVNTIALATPGTGTGGGNAPLA